VSFVVDALTRGVREEKLGLRLWTAGESPEKQGAGSKGSQAESGAGHGGADFGVALADSG